MNNMAAQSLDLVSSELVATLDEARTELEEFVDGRGDEQTLLRCADLLHLSRGALKIAEVHGAALLAEEMEETCRHLSSVGDEDEVEKGIETLVRAMVQLPAYIDRLQGGVGEVALVLLPLLNDLRQLRGKPKLSEGTLVLLNQTSSRGLAPADESRVIIPEERVLAFRRMVGSLRIEFQASLLGWIRDEDAALNLSELARVSRELEAAASLESVRQLWYVLTGVLEALQDGGLEATVALKRFVGQADRQLKHLTDKGEAAFTESPPVELLNSLLYYVARAKGDGERLRSIRTAYGLDEIVPGEDRLAQARDELAGPSAKLMHAVADAIKEDLGGVKDVLDIFVRTGMENVEDLEPQLEMLKKISDTLGVLGLVAAKDDIQRESKTLETIVANQRAPDEAELEQIAATLLEIEDALDTELIRAATPSGEQEKPAGDDSIVQLQQATQSVIGECIVNLARIKEAVVELVERPGDVRILDQIGPQLRGITAGLMMLGKAQAVAVVERIGAIITSRLAPGEKALAADLVERLADAVVSLEYYLETVSAGRRDPWYMLDNAERCLDLLDGSPEPGEDEVAAAGEDVDDQAETLVPDAATVSPHPPVMEADTERSDPELVEIFIEEAKEEVANIRRYLPAWQQDQENSDALLAARRSFHTLKGSGRMVGAQVIGEFAWSVENLLNRIINHTLSPSAEAIQFLSQAAEFLPQLVEQFEIGTQPSDDVELLTKQAHAFAEGDVDVGSLAAALAPSGAVVDPTSAEGAEGLDRDTPQMDPILADIFVKEMRGHLATIRDSLNAIDDETRASIVEEPLFRASHTLLGSANMAGYEPAIALAAPLADYLAQSYESGSLLSLDGLHALSAASDTLERMAEALGDDEVFAEDTTELIAQLTTLTTAHAGDEIEPPPVELETSAVSADFDPEIAAIFTEEAAEILESAELALQDFRSDSPAPECLVELQRLLHTLKGGARMAGISPMGDLSHSLEDLLSGISAARVEPTEEVVDAVQRSLDQLHQMRDAIGAGQTVSGADELLATIQSLSSSSTADGLADSLPVSDYPEAVDEAPDAGDLPVSVVLEGVDAQPLEPESQVEAVAVVEIPDGAVAEHSDAADTAELPPARPAAPPVEPAAQPMIGQELVRVDADLLDALLNGAGEISIFQSRLNQQAHSIDFSLSELGQTVTRLREQLRNLEAETEAEILHRHEQDGAGEEDFDPLELDRYSNIQQLSRALAETASDVGSINELLTQLANETETLLTQQARVTTELQDGLMRTRMVPFQRHVPRLARIVRQASSESGKSAELVVEGGEGELDRQVLECMLPPFEHLLRNAVVHGIELPKMRQEKGKPDVGRVTLKLQREGSEVLISVSDDGAGLDLGGVRSKACEQGLLAEGQEISDVEAAELILSPGLTTAGELTQTAGRGVGMDVVNNEVKNLGGSMRIESEPGAGTRFLIRLPYTLAITSALIVNVGEETFALPLPTVEGVTRVARDTLLEILTEDRPSIEYGGVDYRVQHLGSFVGAAASALPEDDSSVALILVRAGDNSTALLTDSLEGSREVVVKTLGSQITSVPGVSGATILGDGRIIVILDMGTLVRTQGDVDAAQHAPAPPPAAEQEITALVVDDSITMRRVTQRLLERHGVRVLTARDGLDAISVLQDHEPDIILLDIEMPRMDGYQFATHVRNDPKFQHIPIIMITSRSGEKHRARAIELGVNDYLGKPYQEGQLTKAIETLLGRDL